MSEESIPNSISQEPVSILFNPISVVKKDVWDIDIIEILNLLIRILEK
ncbi:MAG: chromosome segregation protein ScpA, partial [Nitrosopumilus sp.]